MCGAAGGGAATGGDGAAALGAAIAFAATAAELSRRHAESIAPIMIVAM